MTHAALRSSRRPRLAAVGLLTLLLTACTGRGGGQLPPDLGHNGSASFGFSFSCEDKGGLNPQTGELRISLSYTERSTSLISGLAVLDPRRRRRARPGDGVELCIGQEPPPGGNELIFLGRYRSTSGGGPTSCADLADTAPSCRFEVIVRDNDQDRAPSPGDSFSIKLSSATTVTSELDPHSSSTPGRACSRAATSPWTRASTTERTYRAWQVPPSPRAAASSPGPPRCPPAPWSAGALPAAAHAAEAGHGAHGVPLRGMYLTSKDRLAEGRFGAMFKRLPAFAPRDDLLDGLARTMVEDQTVPDDSHLNTSPRLFAGYTFIGQFIDHDITFDNTPLDHQQADPYATVNFRTPRYDLDSVYGRGPALEPQYYDAADPDRLRIEPNVHGVLDLPRDGDGHAVVPEGRNDENLIVSQLHQAVVRFHNAVVDQARRQGVRREWVFETARRLTRWHYQWAVVHDFLPRFVGDELVGPNGSVYREVAGKPPVITLNHYKPTNRQGRPFIPVEFAVAAYRFGHSLIRPFYVVNQATLDRGGVPVFGADGGFNLNGGRPVPADLVVEWKHILPVDPSFPARKPRKIDTRLSLPLTPARLGRPAARSHGAPRRPQHPARQARRAAVRPAGREGDARPGPVERGARPVDRPRLGRGGAALVLRPQGGRAPAVQRRAAGAGRRQDRR